MDYKSHVQIIQPNQARVTRRDALRCLSAGALLSMGLWPGCATSHRAETKPFRFIVVNDTHYMTPECGGWLESAVARMKVQDAEFCLHAGDIVEKGERAHLGAVKDIFSVLGIPIHVQIGNHDYLAPSDRGNYESVYPRQINYWFKHRGWQFVAIDSTEGLKYERTSIQAPTIQWLRDTLPKLDPARPTVVFTHFPLGAGVTYRPANADAVLDLFRPFDLRGVFNGHFHGFTERQWNQAPVVTNKCCALKRGNHDRTREKGFFVCRVESGQLTREFVEVPVAPSSNRTAAHETNITSFARSYV